MTVFHWGKAVHTGLLVLALSGSLTGCSVGAKQQSVYDDDTQIVQAGDSYSFVKRTGKGQGNELTLNYRRFYGVQTVWTFDAEDNGQVQIEYDSDVQQGRFKIVLVTSDQEVFIVQEQGGHGAAVFTLPSGTCAVKIVGHGASGSISMQLDTDNDVTDSDAVNGH